MNWRSEGPGAWMLEELIYQGSQAQAHLQTCGTPSLQSASVIYSQPLGQDANCELHISLNVISI